MDSSNDSLIGKKVGSWLIDFYLGCELGKRYYSCTCTECNTSNHRVVKENLTNNLSKRCRQCGYKSTAKNQKGQVRYGQDPQLFSYKRVFRHYVIRAKKSNLKINISLLDFIELSKKNCFYCGIEPNTVSNPLRNCGLSQKKQDMGWITWNGLDRIDSKKGYELKNIVTCCKTCNLAKAQLSTKEFKEWVERIYTHFVLKK